MKTKKMAFGGIGILNSPSQNVQERLKEHPDAAAIRANALAFQPLALARRQYGPDSPDYYNYRAFYGMEKKKLEDLMGGRSLFPRKDVSVGTYTAGTYNPDTDYIAIAQQRAAAIDAARREADAAKKAADAARGAGRGMAKGGMTSSASKRGDGIAQRGKTKCKMR